MFILFCSFRSTITKQLFASHKKHKPEIAIKTATVKEELFRKRAVSGAAHIYFDFLKS